MSRQLPPVIIDGISYPRSVPLPDGLPDGWKAVERAYGPGSKCAGKTYVRFESADGRHKGVSSPVQIIQLHCKDLGIPVEPQLEIYKSAKNAVKNAESNARGECSPEKREEMVALSRDLFGELTGPVTFGMPGWKCRWDWLPGSNQMRRTFIADDGREWKLLKDLECMFGVRIEEGGVEKERIIKMVEAGKVAYAAHDLFKIGGQTARETEAAVTLDPSADNPLMATETLEERETRRREKKDESKRRRTIGAHSLENIAREVHPAQTGWAALATADHLKQAFEKFKACLVAHHFTAIELVAITNVQDSSHYATRVNGIYFRMFQAVNERSAYQRILHAPMCKAGFCCDGVYIVWSSAETRWQICTKPASDAPCIAYCNEDAKQVASLTSSWHIQKAGNGDFEEDAFMKVTKAPA